MLKKKILDEIYEEEPNENLLNPSLNLENNINEKNEILKFNDENENENENENEFNNINKNQIENDLNNFNNLNKFIKKQEKKISKLTMLK